MEYTTLDTGNTAWMIVATILVLMMSIPGIALFYGGLVRQKNVLSVIMQTMLIVGVVSLIWVAIGYSWAFGTGFKESGSWLWFFMGGTEKAFMHGITTHSIMPTGIPEMTFAMFQCMFALITPALILGAFAERIKFKGYMVFTILWVIIAYLPMAHWVWGGGFLQEMGAIDFAGGTVVHINAGISAFIMCLMIGKRDDWRKGHPIMPHNITFVFMGMSFLWLGWFGFNAGSGLAADGLAANAFLVTHDNRLDVQQEANYGRCMYRCSRRTGCHNPCSRFNRHSGCLRHWHHHHHYMLHYGGSDKAQVQV